MRVLFVISGLSLGGAERQVVLLSKELVRLGHAVSIYTLTAAVQRLDELAGEDIDVVVDQKRGKLDAGVLRRLRRHIRAWRPGIVHGFLYDGDIYSRLAAWGTGVPAINSERSDAYELTSLQRLGYRFTAALCDGVVANSHSGAAFARRVHGMDASRVHVVWNGIDLQEIDARLARPHPSASEILPAPGSKRLCMVATIKPEKDHVLALRTVRRLVDADPSWRMVCIGDRLTDATPGYKAEVLLEQQRLRLEPFVSFVGHRRDAPEIIAGCDVLLITSVREGFPNVVLEAMACGTAVVSTDYSDVRRILPDPRQVVAARSDDEIAHAIATCYADRDDIAARQRLWVEAHGTARTSALAMLEVYGRHASQAARPVSQPRRV
jgi:glycosyltransferase involved in cell wall biosynthesis